MNRKRVALLAVVGMVLFAGCLDMTMTVEVDSDGTLEKMEIEMEMNEMAYDALEADASDQGYDSVEAMVEADLLEDTDEEYYGSVSSSFDETDDGYLLTVTATDVDPAGKDDIEVTVEDDTVTFEYFNPTEEVGGEVGDDGDNANDSTGDEFSGFEDQITIEYVLIMPGEIGDNNADEVSDDGTTATWDLMDMDEESIYAESSIDSSSGSSGGLPSPGFGAIAALTGMAIAFFATRGRIDRS